MSDEQIVNDEPLEAGEEEVIVEQEGEPTGEPESEPKGEETPEEKPASEHRVNEGVQKRINEITRQRYEEQRRAEAAEAELERLKNVEDVSKPKEEDFDDYDGYIEALTDYKVQKNLEKMSTQFSQAQIQKQNQERQIKFQQKLGNASVKHPDLNEVLYDENGQPRIFVTDSMSDYIAESETGDDVLYFLGKNPIEANRIAMLPPVLAGRELSRIESGFKSQPSITRAPEPISPVHGKASVSKDPSQMTDREFREWRLKQIKQRR